MALSWNEIRKRAMDFQKRWEGVTRERAETQSFYNEFFEVFGISRRRVATFEQPIKKLGDKQGFIDLFWKGTLLIEQKSAGRDLKKAKEQAYDYFPNLKDNELPQYILVSDFNHFELYDLENNTEYKFQLKDLHKNIELFGFIAGYTKKQYKDLEPVNIEASELMGKLYDKLRISGYSEHDLELFLVRILFCLFADDTGIFERDIFKYLVEEKTSIDGSDTGGKLTELFQILDTPVDKRQKTLDEDLASFPYINGDLFNKSVRIPAFDSDMRKALLDCCYFTWSNISPAIFGSLFQSVADKDKRRNLGEHYTTEKNILKTISPLFLDELHSEFESTKSSKQKRLEKLQAFQQKLSKIKIFDPACGCGNFLVISYREIRKLEIEVLKEINKGTQLLLDATQDSKIDVDNFYGIEIDEFPAKIAEVALWLMDHQMNLELSEAFGQYYARIPLKKSAKIVNGNALEIDWKTVVAPEELSYIVGNPPFIGARTMVETQKNEMLKLFNNLKHPENLDYVCAWYRKSADYIQNTMIKVAFVSTNSITQGEQVGILWNEMFDKYHIKIHFAHRTFCWDSEARGKAHVHCVIIGFANFDTNTKRIFDYEDIKGEAHENIVTNINPYLVDHQNIIVTATSKPICNIPEMRFGNQPRDGGNFILLEDEKDRVLLKEPNLKPFIKTYIGADEFINNKKRYCIWLLGVSPSEISKSKFLTNKIQSVFNFRTDSKAKTTNQYAKVPYIFAQIAQPDSQYLIVPSVSSERRKYIPIGFMNKDAIASNAVQIIPDATLYHFGILTSIMHMTWMKYVCGRLKSDYRYSKDIVYNNFPWTENPSNTAVKSIEEKAQKVLDVRAKYTDCSLADLYDPNTMPPDLVKAHNELDKAVDSSYGRQKFDSEAKRMEFLLDLYEKYTAPLATIDKKKKKSN